MPKKGESCIHPDKVPCDKARSYLAKKGLLCGTEKEKRGSPKVPRKKSFFEEWFK